MQICPNFSLIAYRRDPVRGWLTFRLRCKSWRCPHCAIENQKMWRKHLKRRIIDIGGEWWFGTITAPSWDRRPEATLYTIRLNFDRFMKRLKRVFRTGVNYVRIFEIHKDGAFHLHIIISGLARRVQSSVSRTGSIQFRPTADSAKKGTWSIKTWWKKTLSKCGCGYIADLKPIPATQAIGYITEYMTKQAQDYHVKNLRRIQTSRAIGSPAVKSVDRWQVEPVIYGSNVGFESIIDIDERKVIPASYWRDHVTYPE